MPHFRLTDNGAVTTIVADQCPDGDGWEEVVPTEAPPEPTEPAVVAPAPPVAPVVVPPAQTESTGDEASEETAQ